ncbi:uncharacterized protein LAESUDRAFT_726952 [Laetiporus sulphureus 93-53]|uniref:Uncharacterized protein n=1 Tax=Laetiporus sulphureus 93-53 TaxID=1314785 RepID=A0A165DUP3_9APHY|nr:uncharacterized protein LAESUDRAFT_726952 [Laetiporus sulphureus 93-53]KZT05664.1 hypothetical protein LAESUDRAFT_726952 [Laetiporus sulphureus 93-53]
MFRKSIFQLFSRATTSEAKMKERQNNAQPAPRAEAAPVGGTSSTGPSSSTPVASGSHASRSATTHGGTSSGVHHAKPAPASAAPVQDSKAQAQEERRARHAKLFEEHGIKARDFAYESRHPPIKSVPYFPPIQFQPDPYNRTRMTYEDQFEPDEYTGRTAYFDAETGGVSVGLLPPYKRRALERVPTEPAIDFAPPQPTDDYGLSGFPAVQFAAAPVTPQRNTLQRTFALIGSPVAGPSNRRGVSPSSPPDLQGVSQETEDWTDTPLATPRNNARSPVANTSAIPATELDTPSRVPPAEDVSFSQLGLTPENSPASTHGLRRQRAFSQLPVAQPYFPTTPSSTHNASAPQSPVARLPATPTPTRKRKYKEVAENPSIARSSHYNLRERATALYRSASRGRLTRSMTICVDVDVKRGSPAKTHRDVKDLTSPRPRKSARLSRT